jgi:hypothetical protein
MAISMPEKMPRAERWTSNISILTRYALYKSKMLSNYCQRCNMVHRENSKLRITRWLEFADFAKTAQPLRTLWETHGINAKFHPRMQAKT